MSRAEAQLEPDGPAVRPAAGRVRLRFLEEGAEAKVGAETRVPAGTTVFDAASWNGIAIDSTCGRTPPRASRRTGGTGSRR